MKWFEYDQNNSGGYFIRNDTVADKIFIEAENADTANCKAIDITEDYSDFCECCGERWSFHNDDNDGTDEPMIYNTKVRDGFGSFYHDGYILLHHANGTVERLNPINYQIPSEEN